MSSEDLADRKKCSGIRKSGYWKGYPCGSVATLDGPDGKRYCANHYPHQPTTEAQGVLSEPD